MELNIFHFDRKVCVHQRQCLSSKPDHNPKPLCFLFAIQPTRLKSQQHEIKTGGQKEVSGFQEEPLLNMLFIDRIILRLPSRPFSEYQVRVFRLNAINVTVLASAILHTARDCQTSGLRAPLACTPSRARNRGQIHSSIAFFNTKSCETSKKGNNKLDLWEWNSDILCCLPCFLLSRESCAIIIIEDIKFRRLTPFLIFLASSPYSLCYSTRKTSTKFQPTAEN